ncbi:TPA: hypothetical protein N0F65_012025 [Lagenidium giganteum]|uniref:Sulfhydryl oxidase n=1 Tax=Lagenidium giganteum TaxID=4803 RepID=A0AAV2YPE7_9STRA|nr:TPA: hypothetical protein N0F65_012025 [Lagenidium giganteum]
MTRNGRSASAMVTPTTTTTTTTMKHTRRDMDQVDARTCSYAEFCERYMRRNLPVRIKHVADSWRATTAWKTHGHGAIAFAALRDQYGHATAPVVDGDVVDYGAEARCSMVLGEYLALMEAGGAGKRYLKDWHFVQAFKDQPPVYETPVFFKDDWLNWWWDKKDTGGDDYRFVYIGMSAQRSWSVNVCGRKRWLFVHPDDEDKLKDRFGRYVVPDLTAKDIDHERFPHVHEVDIMEVIQDAGEAIFVPSGWYHQVENLEDTISINHNWFNGFCIRKIWQFLRRELAAVEKELDDLRDIGMTPTEFADQCQLVMRANTGMNMVEFQQLLTAKEQDLERQSGSRDTAAPEEQQYASEHLKCDELEALKQANDALYRQHANEKAQMQLAIEQEKITVAELSQANEEYRSVNEQWEESYNALDQEKRVLEEKVVVLEDKVVSLEDNMKSYSSELITELEELEKEKTDLMAQSETINTLQQQINDGNDRFAQLNTMYEELNETYRQALLEKSQVEEKQWEIEAYYQGKVAERDGDVAGLQDQIKAFDGRVADLLSQIDRLQARIHAMTADGEVKDVNQSAFLKKAQEDIDARDRTISDLTTQVSELTRHIQDLDGQVQMLTLGSGTDQSSNLRDLQQQLFEKSEELVAQGEKTMEIAEKHEVLKQQLRDLRQEVKDVRGTLLRGIAGNDVDETLYQHVKLEELVRLRLKSLEHEWLLSAPSTAGSSLGISSNDDQGDLSTPESAPSGSVHVANVEKFSAMDALGSVGRLERDLRLARSRNKRLMERVEHLERELNEASKGLTEFQALKEKAVEMASRERIEKELRQKAEVTVKESAEKIVALSEHIEKLMVHLKHEAAAKTKAIDLQKRTEKELNECKERSAMLSKKSVLKEQQVEELEQGAKILEDQLRLMDEKFIEVRNKLDWTRATSQKEMRKVQQELSTLRMKWQLASDSGVLTMLPDWANLAKTPKNAPKLPLGASASESQLTAPTSNNNFSMGLPGSPKGHGSILRSSRANLQELDDRKAKNLRFEIPKLPQSEQDTGMPWSDAKLSVLQRQLQDKRKIGASLAVAATWLLAASTAPIGVVANGMNGFRDTRPLFEDSFHVRVLDDELFGKSVNSTTDVWVVDFYSPWCPHCRHFAPELEKIAAFYSKSNVRVGAVDCTRNNALCDREQIMAYPAIKLFNVPPKAPSIKLTGYGNRDLKGVVNWVEALLTEHNMKSGISADDIDQQMELMRNERVRDDANGDGVLNEQGLGLKYARLQDAGSAAVFTLENALFMGKNTLEGERYTAAVQWVQALAVTFPLEANRKAFAELAAIVTKRESWDKDSWDSTVAKWKTHFQDSTFPKALLTAGQQDGWLHCNTYTCALWTLFHAMSVNTDAPSCTLKPSQVAAAIRLFVQHFFGCAECVEHFMRANPETVITQLSTKDEDAQAITLWLWRMHNKVNKVTKKNFFPTTKQCPICFADNVVVESLDPAILKEDEITAFVRSAYSFKEEDVSGMVYAHGGVTSLLANSVGGISNQFVLLVGVVVCCVGFSQKNRLFASRHKHLA